MAFAGLLWGWMEFCHFFLFVMFVVLTVDQFVERGDGPF